MGAGNKTFPLEFKKKVVRALILTDSISQVARDFKISRNTVYKIKKEQWAQEMMEQEISTREVEHKLEVIKEKMEHGEIEILSNLDQTIELALAKVHNLLPKLEDAEVASRIAKNLHYIRSNRIVIKDDKPTDFWQLIESKINNSKE